VRPASMRVARKPSDGNWFANREVSGSSWRDQVPYRPLVKIQYNSLIDDMYLKHLSTVIWRWFATISNGNTVTIKGLVVVAVNCIRNIDQY
jgi:hypothetical protein